MLTILNHQGAAIERELLSHWSKPTVISPPPGTPPWQWPGEIDVLLTTPNGWIGAPAIPTPGCGRLRLVQLDSVGIDAYPRWLLEGAPVSNARGSNAVPLTEYAMAAILGFEKRLDRICIYSVDEWGPASVGQVEDRTLGIVGYGSVGQELAKRGQAFGMRIAAFKRTPWYRVPGGVMTVDSIGELASISDHLVLACPLTPQTAHMIDRAVLASARPGLHLVNIARGGLIDDDALLAALDSGQVAQASLDVTAPEPLPAGHPYYRHPRVRLTPHIAWSGSGNQTRMRRIVLDNLTALLRGEPLRNLVELDRGY